MENKVGYYQVVWESFTTNKEWKQYLQQLMLYNKEALLKALMLINDSQTESEKEFKMSIEDNNVGFTKVDAHILSILADKVKQKRNLTPRELDIVKHRMQKYWKQLMVISKAKQLAKQLEAENKCKAQQAQQLRLRDEQIQLCIECNIPCSYGICSECTAQY